MSDLKDLETAFQPKSEQSKATPGPRPSGTVTVEYEERLRTLGRQWHAILDTPGAHQYTSASEADMALICRMAACNFTEGEIWRTLESSPRYADRTERKGERHARKLYGDEIAKAQATVTRFPDTPMPVVRPTQAKPRVSANGKSNPQAAPAPFHIATRPDSFVSRYIEYGSARTDAPREAHELMAVGTLSALAGPTPRLPISTSSKGWSLALWIMYIVNSTVGRKTTVIEQGAHIIEEILGERAVISWEGSPQGFIQRMQERDGQPAAFVRDEFSGLMQQMNKGGHMAGLSQTLIRAYDGRLIENIRTRKKGKDGEFQRDEDRVKEPYLATLAASTRDSFLQRATTDNVLDGFLARFAFISASAEERPLGVLTPGLSAQRAALVAHARRFYEKAQQCALVDIGEGVLDMQWELERKWQALAQKTSRPEAAGPSMKRLAETVLKTAALLALDDCDDLHPIVTTEHFLIAQAMGERWQVSTLAIVEDLGATVFLRDCNAVMASVRGESGGIQLSKLYRKHRNLKGRAFDDVLGALETQERIERVQINTGQAGRKPVMVYPFGGAPKDLGA